jgi:hypothetical protein
MGQGVYKTAEEERVGRMQAAAEQSPCGFGRPQKAERLPSNPSTTRSAGHEASLAGKKRRRLRVRCYSTSITEKTHDSCASSTASREQSHHFLCSFLFGGVFRHQAEGRGLPVELCARSGCDTQIPANLLKAAPTPVLMIFPPTWLGCDGPRI